MRISTSHRSQVIGLLTFALVVALLPTGAQAAVDRDPVRLLVAYDAPVTGAVALADAGLEMAQTSRSSSRVQVLEVAGGRDVDAIVARLEASEGVLAVEHDRLIEIHPAVQQSDEDEDARWPIENRGQDIRGVPGARGMDIGAVPAWDAATGAGVLVAVIDGMVDIAHPALQDRIWRNPGEAVTGQDDDGNGFVDDVHGWDFVRSDPIVPGIGRAELHGTHVAGLIAGAPDPETGFSGVAPDAVIMPLRVAGTTGRGWYSDVIFAVRYAADNGADVINMSLGGFFESQVFRATLEEARIPIVVSAGNTGRSLERLPVYPAANPVSNQLTVAAIDHLGELAPFSSFSQQFVDVAAPGLDIISTAPGDGYEPLSGTSMAAPLVTGAVALAIEAAPRASTSDLLAAVRRGVRPAAAATETTSTGGIARAAGTLAALGVRLPVCANPRDLPFTDVPRSHTHFLGVSCLYDQGATQGVARDRYGADALLFRGQVASMVADLLGRAGLAPPVPADSLYTDVSGSVHGNNIEALAGVGIIAVPPGRFEPMRTVTRGEFAAIVARAADYAAGAPARPGPARFGDIAGHPEQDLIELAAELSLVAGRSPGVFDADTTLRRDQAATMLTRLLDRLYQQGLMDPA